MTPEHYRLQEERITQLANIVEAQQNGLANLAKFITSFQPVAVDLRIEGTIHRVTILAVPPKPPEEKPTFTIVT